MENNLNTMYISYKEEIHKITQLQKPSNINWLINDNAKHWDIFGASIQGDSHKKKGKPNQDAFAGKVFSNGLSVVAVADGAGSATRSEEGSRRAVDSIITYFSKINIVKYSTFTKLLKISFYYARKELERLASESNSNLKDFACTLLVSVAFKDFVVVGGIGDGGIVTRTVKELLLFTELHPSEYANETTFLTSDSWKNEIFIYPLPRTDVLALFTDGCTDAILIPKKGNSFLYDIYNDFFEYIFKYILKNRCKKSKHEINSDIEGLLSSANFKKHVDDKTLVIMVVNL